MPPCVIHDSRKPRQGTSDLRAGWLVIQAPGYGLEPQDVWFYCSNGQWNLLDQIAAWDPLKSDWSLARWVPKPKVVPQWLIDKVVAHMRFQDMHTDA